MQDQYTGCMKIVETLADFPAKPPRLRGLDAEAYELLKAIEKSKPVLRVNPEGQNVGAVKRAFARAAKGLGGSVRSQNAEDGMILVKWSSTQASATQATIQHSQAAVEAEARRLYVAAGHRESSYDRLTAEAKKKLTTSAKRNLSRAARA